MTDLTKNSKRDWDLYLERNLPAVKALLLSHNIELDKEQPHLLGERFLMQAMTTKGGQKMILVGTEINVGTKLVIKVSNTKSGREEIIHERLCRQYLNQLNFAYETFHSSREILYLEDKYTIVANEFIEQERPFLERSLKEQFSFALLGLKAQNSMRATTNKHVSEAIRTFGLVREKYYLDRLREFKIVIKDSEVCNDDLSNLLRNVETKVRSGKVFIEQYGHFLTHTDFVPHNFRIMENKIYLLDFSSLRFGNKHEGWARFLNFMTLHNQDLESAFLRYQKDNWSSEEIESLHMMRLYRLCELIAYYVKTLDKSTGELKQLNEVRVRFWTEVLKAETARQTIDQNLVHRYKQNRDKLRSEDEKKRQIGLH